MGLWTVQVKNTSLTPVWMMRNLKPSSANLGKVGVFEIRLLKTRVLFSSNVYHHSLLVKAMAKKNHDNPSGNGDREGDNLKRNNSSDNKSNDTASQKSHCINLDWREFRANLCSGTDYYQTPQHKNVQKFHWLF
ncbi:uncharacterized protein LOC123229471 [Mangifera indica]|uniref:uncharacterized protein LOC123229471 n=1 Tax=Mangifera indica TaxID=29780 RepID=UPI001CF9BD3A|nr:uncharacterized protein LOC123229471 [Mangifera indica]